MEQKTVTIPFDLETAKRINIGGIVGRIVTEKGRNRAEIVYEDNSSSCPLLVVIHSITVSADWFSATGKALSSENRLLLEVPEYITFKAKAEATDEQIKKQAEEMTKPEVVTLKVCFDTYGLLYRPNTCVDVEIPFYDDEKIRDMLNKASADIMKWCDKNMIKYNKELKESRSTKKHCEGLRKHIANLERRLLRHTLANVILSIISVAAIIALFTLIQN